MKDKNVAGLFAVFLGAFGVHRFYLGQIKLGVLYAMLCFTGISAIIGVIDAIVFFKMSPEEFDRKYNQANNYEQIPRDRKYIDHRKRNQTHRKTAPPPKVKRQNPYKLSGIQKYKDYDYEEAIEDFRKALAINSKDIAVHFNLACAYSITEQPQKALEHLDKAIEYGFVDFDKIKNHDALAYVRIQDEYQTFVKNGFRLSPQATKNTIPAEEEPPISGDLLEQIKKLGELREKGFLTEEEFVAQKRRLLK